MDELKKIIQTSQILKEDDKNWPQPNKVGMQELEIVIDGKHKSFSLSKLGSFVEVHQSKDPEGLPVLWFFIQDIRCFVLSLINAHFRERPVN